MAITLSIRQIFKPKFEIVGLYFFEREEYGISNFPSLTGTSLPVLGSVRVPENVPLTLVPEEFIVIVISLQLYVLVGSADTHICTHITTKTRRQAEIYDSGSVNGSSVYYLICSIS